MSAREPISGLAESPERHYTYAGRVAHLHAYGTDFGAFPYSAAWCGFSPTWGSAWLGTGTQAEEDRAAALPLCARCQAQDSPKERKQAMSGALVSQTKRDDGVTVFRHEPTLLPDGQRQCDSGCERPAAFVGTLHTSGYQIGLIECPDVAYCQNCADHPSISDDYRDRTPSPSSVEVPTSTERSEQ